MKSIDSQELMNFIDKAIDSNKTINAMKSDIEVVKKKIGTLDSDVGTLKSDVGTLKSDVGTLKSDVVTIKNELQRQGLVQDVMSDKIQRILDALDTSLKKGEIVETHEVRLDQHDQQIDLVHGSLKRHLLNKKVHNTIHTIHKKDS